METTRSFKQDFLDILFNGRNKDYGAYDLRRRYDKRVRNAVIGMAGIVLLIIGGYSIGSKVKAGEKAIKPYFTETKLIELPPAEIPPVTPPPPPPAEPPAASRPMVHHATFAVVPNEQVNPEDEPLKNSQLADVSIGLSNQDGDVNGVDNGVPDGFAGGHNVVEPPKVEEKPEVFITVEIMPEFPGGEKKMIDYLSNNTRYPSVAAENGIEGTVFVKFVVGETGEVRNVEVIGAKKGGGLEEEAMRVIRKMPKWKPGRQNGRNVAVYFNLPVSFKLQQ